MFGHDRSGKHGDSGLELRVPRLLDAPLQQLHAPKHVIVVGCSLGTERFDECFDVSSSSV